MYVRSCWMNLNMTDRFQGCGNLYHPVSAMHDEEYDTDQDVRGECLEEFRNGGCEASER